MLADQATAEAKRMSERVAAGLLDDPSPFGKADKIIVHVDVPALAAEAGAPE